MALQDRRLVEGVYLSPSNCEPSLFAELGLEQFDRMIRRRDVVAVDAGAHLGDGFPNRLPNGPFWLFNRRADFEERLRVTVRPVWASSHLGRSGSVGFVSRTVPTVVELEPQLIAYLERGPKRRLWR